MNSGLRGRQKKKMLNTNSRMKQNDKIYVAGHSGLVGDALVRLLKARGFNNLITRSRAEVDLRDERAVRNLFAEQRPELAVLAAAKIGGVKLCQAFAREYGANFISVMPTNLYGPGDDFDLETSHALAALLRKAHEAKMSGAGDMIVWGTGEPRREFLHVDDLAAAVLFLLENYDSPEIINVGCGEDISIRELAELICDVVGFRGELKWDRSKPDGTPRKLLDISKIKKLGWQPTISLRDGVARLYEWFLDNYAPQSMASVR